MPVELAQIRDGMWSGQRCFVVGGGPSLRGFDWDLLKGELVIGTNRVYEYFDPSILFGIDKRFFLNIIQGKYGESAREKFYASKAMKFRVNTGGDDELKDMGFATVKNAGKSGATKSLNDGLKTGGNSGYCAINLAMCLGATEIYLLGFDMRGDADGNQAHFHDGHPNKQTENVYAGFLKHFPGIEKEAQERGVNIFNVHDGSSAIECFRSIDLYMLRTINKPVRPLVVSFYTRGNGYQAYAEQMERTARMYGLECDIEAINDIGSWASNTQYKCRFLRRKLKEYDRPILWIDADGIVCQYPKFFDDNESSFCVSFNDWESLTAKRGNRRGMELNSAVMYLRPDAITFDMLYKWIDEIERAANMPGRAPFEQKILQDILDDPTNKEIREAGDIMPMAYCQIHDHMAEAGDPVIKQLQASRELRNERAEQCV